MKTSLGIRKLFRILYSYWNLFRFQWRKTLLGFDIANQFIQRVDENTIQLILKRNSITISNDCDT